MLRTNDYFLNYIENLYDDQSRKENIIIKKFSKGQRLLDQNQPASKIIFIKEGISKCFFTEDNDKEYILEFLGTGEILGEIELISGLPCLCSVEAVSDVLVYAVAPSYFLELIKNDLKLNNLLLNSFTQRIINTSSRASFQQLYTVEHSLAKLLELQSKQGINISKENMASYLGITLRSLNRVMRNMPVLYPE